MSKLFGFIIDPKCIEFTGACIEKFFKSTDSIVGEYQHEEFEVGINCYIVWNMFHPKLTLTDVDLLDSSVMYKVNIHTPSDCPHLFEVNNKPKPNIVMIYRKRFKVGNFINDVFDTIGRSMDYMSDEYFQNALSIYYDYDCMDDNSDDFEMVEPNPIHVKSNKIKCVLSKEHSAKCFGILDTFDACHNYNYKSMITVNLYMIQIKPNEIHRDNKVRIKFKSNQFVYEDNYVGLPLNVWVNKNDTLQYIIDMYLKNIKKYISKCFRVNGTKNKQAKIIKIHRWYGYKVYQKLDLQNEYLLFKIRAIYNCNLELSWFDQSSHDMIDNSYDIDVEIEINENEMELSPTPPLYGKSPSPPFILTV